MEPPKKGQKPWQENAWPISYGNGMTFLQRDRTTDRIVNSSSYQSSPKELRSQGNATFGVKEPTLRFKALCISQAIVGLLFSGDLNGGGVISMRASI